MQQITVHFQPDEGTIDGRHVTARGLHGLLFNVLRQADPTGATWLHRHPTPKPFSLVPLYTEAGQLAGLRLAAVTERAGSLLLRAWERVWQQQRPLRLGWQEFRTVNVAPSPGPGWAALAASQPAREMVLHFLSPTSFKQGPGSLPLPLPVNVFSGPARVWDAFAGKPLPPDWLAWCEQEVFVVGHRIETVAVKISKREQFTGFVGDVKFAANEGTKTALCVWQALGELAAFCGVGHKTTMGMGAVARDGR